MGARAKDTPASPPDRRAARHVRRAAVVTLLAGALVAFSGGTAYAGKPTVTPNPVAPGGFIFVTPDAACIAAAAKVPSTAWKLTNGGRISWGTRIQPSAVVVELPDLPGLWVLTGWQTNQDGTLYKRLVECGETEIGAVGPPAQTGAGLVVSSGIVGLKTGESSTAVGALFRPGPLLQSGTVTNMSVEVTLTGGLTFLDGSQVFGAARPDALAIALAQPITAKSAGVALIKVTAAIQFGNTSSAYVDAAQAGVNVASPITPTPAPVTPAAPPNPAPAPVTPAAPPGTPAPAPVTPAPAPTQPATPVAGNQPPVAVTSSVVAKKNTATPLTLKGTDPEGTKLTYSIVDFPEHGRLTGRAPNLTYKPDSGFVGTDAFTFTVNDGTTISEPAAVSITVKSTKTVTRKPTTKRKK